MVHANALAVSRTLISGHQQLVYIYCHMEPNSDRCGSKMSIHDLLLLLFTPVLQYILMGLASYVSHFFGHQHLQSTVLWSPILLSVVRLIHIVVV